MLINTANSGWVRPAAKHAIPPVPTTHPSGFKDGHYSEWKLKGYPNIATFLNVWAEKIHASHGVVPKWGDTEEERILYYVED